MAGSNPAMTTEDAADMMRLFRRFKDLGIHGAQARHYDKVCRAHRLEEIKAEAAEVVKHLKSGDSVLELACGPGYLAIEISKLGRGQYKITGLDISNEFVVIAKKNAQEAGADIDFKQGNAANMPFQANMFDFVVCVLAFKNFKAPLEALKEIFRVLKPCGTALILDLDRNAPLKAVKNLAENMGLNGLQAYIASSLQRSGAYTSKEFEGMISQTDFDRCQIRTSPVGLSIILKKGNR